MIPSNTQFHSEIEFHPHMDSCQTRESICCSNVPPLWRDTIFHILERPSSCDSSRVRLNIRHRKRFLITYCHALERNFSHWVIYAVATTIHGKVREIIWSARMRVSIVCCIVFFGVHIRSLFRALSICRKPICWKVQVKYWDKKLMVGVNDNYVNEAC